MVFLTCLTLFLVTHAYIIDISRRRKSAMNLLRKNRKMTRVDAILFGYRNRAKSFGILQSLAKTLAILSVDVLRSVLVAMVRVGLIYPSRLVSEAVKAFTPRKRYN